MTAGTPHLTVSEAARVLGQTRSLVRAQMDDGTLERIYDRDTYEFRVTIESVHRLIAERAENPTPAPAPAPEPPATARWLRAASPGSRAACRGEMSDAPSKRKGPPSRTASPTRTCPSPGH